AVDGGDGTGALGHVGDGAALGEGGRGDVVGADRVPELGLEDVDLEPAVAVETLEADVVEPGCDDGVLDVGDDRGAVVVEPHAGDDDGFRCGLRGGRGRGDDAPGQQHCCGRGGCEPPGDGREW